MVEPGKRGMTGKHGKQRRGPKAPRTQIACEVCGTVREYRESEIRVRGKIRFCSLACRNAGQMKPGWLVDVTCDHCGKAFKKRSDHVARRKHVYCSRECSAAARRTPNARWRNPAQIRQYMQSYSEKNRDRINALARRWGANNRPKKLANLRARRAAASVSQFTADDWERMKAFYAYRCLSCRQREPDIKLEADHIVPIKMGGSHSWDNLQPLCHPCNASKGIQVIDYRAA